MLLVAFTIACTHFTYNSDYVYTQMLHSVILYLPFTKDVTVF